MKNIRGVLDKMKNIRDVLDLRHKKSLRLGLLLLSTLFIVCESAV